MIQSLQFLRAVAVMSVMLYHFAPIEIKYSTGPIWLSFFRHIGFYGVDLFFIISGYIMVYTTQSQWGKRHRCRRFLYRRAVRIYPLYWMVSLVLVVAYSAFPQWFNFAQNLDVEYVIKSVLLIPQAENPLLSVGWTLIFEMFFYGIFSLFLLGRKDRLIYYLLAWVMLIFLGNVLHELNAINIWFKTILSPFCLEFIAGCLLALFVSRSRPVLPLRWLVMGGVTWLMAGAMFFSEADGLWIRVGVAIPSLSLLMLAMLCLEQDGRLRISPIWIAIGNASYAIYLTHLLVLTAVAKIWHRFVGPDIIANSALQHLLFIVLATMLSIVAGYCLYRWCERPMLLYMRRITR